MKIAVGDRAAVGAQGNEALIGALLMLGAAVVFAFLGVFVKMMGPRFRVWDIATYRFWGGVAILVLAFGARGNFFRPHHPKLMVFRGVVGAMAFVFLVAAIRSIPFSTAMVFFYSFPAFSAVFSAWLFQERASAREWFCIGLTLAGSAVLFDFGLGGAALGQCAALLAGMFAGLTASLIRKLRETNGSAAIYFYMCLCGGLIALPFYAGDPRLPSEAGEWLLAGGIVFTSVAAQLMMTQGFKYCTSWEGGVIMTSEVLFALALGIVLFAEKPSWRLWVGGGMVIAGALGIRRKRRPKI